MSKHAVALALLVATAMLWGCHHNSSGVGEQAGHEQYIRIASCFHPPFPI